jgi:hypothetical protein
VAGVTQVIANNSQPRLQVAGGVWARVDKLTPRRVRDDGGGRLEQRRADERQSAGAGTDDGGGPAALFAGWRRNGRAAQTSCGKRQPAAADAQSATSTALAMATPRLGNASLFQFTPGVHVHEFPIAANSLTALVLPPAPPHACSVAQRTRRNSAHFACGGYDATNNFFGAGLYYEQRPKIAIAKPGAGYFSLWPSTQTGRCNPALRANRFIRCCK